MAIDPVKIVEHHISEGVSMPKIVNAALVDLEGNNLKVLEPNLPPAAQPNAPDLTVARVLVNCALTPAQNAPFTAEQTAARYDLALRLYKAEIGDEVEVPAELIPALKTDVLRLYAPVVGGQMLKVLA
jgi:hypothetical protein